MSLPLGLFLFVATYIFAPAAFAGGGYKLAAMSVSAPVTVRAGQKCTVSARLYDPWTNRGLVDPVFISDGQATWVAGGITCWTSSSGVAATQIVFSTPGRYAIFAEFWGDGYSRETAAIAWIAVTK